METVSTSVLLKPVNLMKMTDKREITLKNIVSLKPVCLTGFVKT